MSSMNAKRVDDEGFEIVHASPQVMVTDSSGTRVAGTLQLLTSDGSSFEEPLDSERIVGRGWNGAISDKPEVGLPGNVSPIVWINPNHVNDDMRAVCVEIVVADDGDHRVNVPSGFPPRWAATGGPGEHSYSLRPTLTIADSMPARFTESAPGSLPAREDEGNVVRIAAGNGLDDLGVVVDVDMTTFTGLAILFRTLLDLLP